VDVDVGQRVASHVVEERQVQEAALLPVDLGVGKYEMQDGHQQDVSAEKDKERVVHARTERVWEEDEDEEPSQDLEEHWEEQDRTVEERGQVLVERTPLEGGVIRGKAPGQTQNGGDDGNRLKMKILKCNNYLLHAEIVLNFLIHIQHFIMKKSITNWNVLVKRPFYLVRFEHWKFEALCFTDCKNAETERVGCHRSHQHWEYYVKLKIENNIH